MNVARCALAAGVQMNRWVREKAPMYLKWLEKRFLRINFGFCDYFSTTGRNAPKWSRMTVLERLRKHHSFTSFLVQPPYPQNGIIKFNELPAFAPVGSTGPVEPTGANAGSSLNLIIPFWGYGGWTKNDVKEWCLRKRSRTVIRDHFGAFRPVVEK